MQKCPLCLEVSRQVSIFSHKNTFVSVSTLSETPNLDISNQHYASGSVDMELLQCNTCGFIFNKKFDLEKIVKQYSSKTYISRKIVSDSMNQTLHTIKDRIIGHYNNMGGG